MILTTTKQVPATTIGYTVLTRDGRSVLRIGWAWGFYFGGGAENPKIWCPVATAEFDTIGYEQSCVAYSSLDECAKTCGELGAVPWKLVHENGKTELRPVTQKDMKAIGWERAAQA